MRGDVDVPIGNVVGLVDEIFPERRVNERKVLNENIGCIADGERDRTRKHGRGSTCCPSRLIWIVPPSGRSHPGYHLRTDDCLCLT